MTSTKQWNSGAPLPEQLDDHPTICFTMSWPDNLEYRTALMGVVTLLGKWWHWEKSGNIGNDRRASDAATYLREFIITAQFSEDCEVPYQLRVQDCILEYSENGGLTWQPVLGWDADCFVGPPGPQGEQGEPGLDGVCEDCGDTPAPEDDNGTPPPPGTPGDEQRCKVAQGVVDSLLDNYYIPVLDYWIDVFVTQGLQAVDAVEALRLMLIGQSAGALAWPPSAVGLIGSIGSALFGVMVALTSAAEAQNNLDIKNALNDEETREQIYCMLYKVLDDDGNISATVWGDFLSALQSEGGLPFIDLWNYLKDFIPLYVARTEAYITQGGDFDCDECQDDCALVNITWNTLNEAPYAGWESMPATWDWTGWSGDLTSINQGTLNFSCTRNANEYWSSPRNASSNNAAKIGIVYTLPEPCDIFQLQMGQFANNGNGKRIALGIENVNGDKKILVNTLFPVVAPTGVSLEWTGLEAGVTKIYFIGTHGGTSGAPHQIRQVQVNNS